MQGITSSTSKLPEISATKASLSSNLRMNNQGEVWCTASNTGFRGNSASSNNTSFVTLNSTSANSQDPNRFLAVSYNGINRDPNHKGDGPAEHYNNAEDGNNSKEEVLLFERSTSAPPPPFADSAAAESSTINSDSNGFNPSTSTSLYRPLLEDLLNTTTLNTKYSPNTSTVIGKSGTSSTNQNNLKDFYHAGNSLTWDSQTFKRMGGFSSLFASATAQKTRFLEDVDELYSTTTATTATATSRLEDLFQRNNHNTVGPFTNTSGGIFTSDTVRSLPSNNGRNRITTNSTAVSDLQSLFLQPTSTAGRTNATSTVTTKSATATETASSDILSHKFTNMNVATDNSHQHQIPNNSSSYDDDSTHLSQANTITINALSCLNSPRQKSNKACDSTSTTHAITTNANTPPTMSLEQQQQQESHRRSQDHSASAATAPTSALHLTSTQPPPPPGLSNTSSDPNPTAILQQQQQQQLANSTQAPYYTATYPSSEVNSIVPNGNIVYSQPVFDWSHQQPHVLTTPHINYNTKGNEPSTASTVNSMGQQQQHIYYSYGGIPYATNAVTTMQPRNPNNTMHFNTNATAPSPTILPSQPYHQHHHTQYHVVPNLDRQQPQHPITISSTNSYGAQPNTGSTVAFASSPTIYANSAAMLHSPQHQQNIQYTYPPNAAAATLPPTTTVLYPYSLSVVEPSTTYTVVASNSAPMAANDQHYLVVQQPNGQVLLTPTAAASTNIVRQQQHQHQPQPHLNGNSYAAAVRFNNNRKSYNKRGTFSKDHQQDVIQKSIKQKNVITSAKKKNDVNLLEEFKRTYKTKHWTVETKLSG